MDLTINNSFTPFKNKNLKEINQGQKKSFAQFGTQKYCSYYPNIMDPYLNIQTKNKCKKIKEINIPNIGTSHVYKLSNGHRIIIIPKRGTFEINTLVNTDLQEDTVISHFVEHLIANGENSFNASTFKKELDRIGASMHAKTTENTVNYKISYPFDDKKDIELIIEMQAQMLQNPKFNKDKVEREKGVLISEYVLENSSEDNKDKEKSALKKRVVNSLFGTNLPLLTNSNTVNNIKSISLDSIQNFYDKYYQNNNMQTIVVGDINPNEIIKLFEKYFNKQNKNQQKKSKSYTPVNLPQAPKRLDLKFGFNKGNIAQINFPAFNYDSTKDRIIFDILKELAKIKECDFDINLLDASDYGIKPTVISIQAECQDNDSNQNLEKLQSELIKFLNSGITQDELNIIKKRGKLSSFLISEDNCLLAELLNTMNPNDNYLIQKQKLLNEITTVDIKEFINTYFKFDKALYLSASDNPKIYNQPVTFKGSKKTFKLNANEYVYPNNMQLIVNSDEENKLTSYHLAFQTEDLGKPKPAILEFLKYMMQFAIKNNLPKELSIEPNIILTNNSLDISGISNPEDTIKLIEFINKTVQYREYSPEFFDEIKRLLKNEVQDDYFMSKLTNLEFGDNNVKLLDKIAKKEDKIKAINDVSLSDILSFLDRITKKSQAKAVLVLPNSLLKSAKNDIFATVNKGFSWNFKPKNDINIEQLLHLKANDSLLPNVLIDIQNNNIADICFSYKIADCKDEKESIMADMLSVILNNRIFSEIREKYGIGYYLGANYEQNSGSNHITIKCNFKCDKENAQDLRKVVNEIQKIINDIVSKPISKDELESLKLEYKKFWLENSMTTLGKAGLLSSYSIDELNKKYQIIESISKNELLQSARKHLAAKPNIVIRANKDTINSNIGYITTLGRLV